MIGAGLLPTVGYLLLGPPDPGPRASTGTLPVEYWAQSAAELLFIAGAIAFAVAVGFGVASGRRREAQELRHEERRRRRLGTP